MPAVLAVVAKAAGLPAAKALAQAYGGRRLFVPKQAKKKHAIAAAVGHDGMSALVDAFGGERIDVPLWTFSGIKTFIAGQRRAIIARTQDGESQSKIARDLGCTERAVRKVRAHARRLGQGNLFES